MKFKKIYSVIFLFPSICLADATATQDDPCDNFFSLINRPTNLNTPCAVKPGAVVVEGGYQYQNLYPGDGSGNNFPNLDFRFGLLLGNELEILAPNYIENHENDEKLTGSNATVVGLKHQFPIFQTKWTYAAQTLFTLPTGNNNFGSEELGVTINAIVNYALTADISAAVMLGGSSQTTSFSQGGERYNSFNPDFLISWQTTKNFQVFAEIYGQTKTAPDENSGYNADGGVQYLITENIEIDAEYGVRLSGQLGGFAQYFGFGGGVRF